MLQLSLCSHRGMCSVARTRVIPWFRGVTGAGAASTAPQCDESYNLDALRPWTTGSKRSKCLILHMPTMTAVKISDCRTAVWDRNPALCLKGSRGDHKLWNCCCFMVTKWMAFWIWPLRSTLTTSHSNWTEHSQNLFSAIIHNERHWWRLEYLASAF